MYKCAILYYGDMHIILLLYDRSEECTGPAIFTTYTGTSTCVQTMNCSNERWNSSPVSWNHDVTKTHREWSLSVYHKRGPGPLRGPVPLSFTLQHVHASVEHVHASVEHMHASVEHVHAMRCAYAHFS